MSVQIQFPGYAPASFDLPLSVSPFEGVDSAEAASEIVESTLMSDEDENGWCSGEAAGESFQVRRAG